MNSSSRNFDYHFGASRRTPGRALVMLVLLATATVDAVAQQHVYSPLDVLSDSNITVRVYGPDNKPLRQMAFVTLYRKGSNLPLGTIMTTVSAEAVLTGMQGYGPYTVEVSATGCTIERQDFDYNASSGRVEVDVTLHALPNSATTPAPAAPLDPKARELVQKGLKAMQVGNFQDAQTEFIAARKTAPQNPDVCYLLGTAYQKGKDLQNAQVFFEKATSIDPDHVKALVALGQVRDQQKNYQAAITPLEKASSLDGKEWLARWVLADAYLRIGEYEKALKSAQAAVELGNGAANKAELIEGEALAQLGRRDDAIKMLETFLHDMPGDPAAPSVRVFIAKLKGGAPESSDKRN